MQNACAILACGSMFGGANATLLMSAVVSFFLAVLMGIANVVLICVLEHRRQPTTRHLVSFLGYFLGGILIFTGAIKDINVGCVAVIVVAAIISAHMFWIIECVRRNPRGPIP
jgi:drug/metabolite transporter (DMT)-like permease